MDNSTAIPLQGDTLLVTQLELVTPTTVAGTLYGIAFTLFCLYIHAISPRLWNGDRTRQAQLMVAYSTVIMLCGLYALVYNAWLAQDAYIKHSSWPGGPYVYIISINHTNSVISVGLACQVAVDVLISAIQVWRVRVIWSATRYANWVTVLPALCLLTFTGLRLRTVILTATLPATEVFQLDDGAEAVAIALQATTTILCTLLISVYLIPKHRQQRKLIGQLEGLTGYINIVAMLIESYALESIWLLAYVLLWNRPAQALFGESVTYIEIVAYLLLQYRVACGTTYASQDHQKKMSSLRWNHSNHAATQFGEVVEIPGILHVSAIPEA